jgi:TolB-like protein
LALIVLGYMFIPKLFESSGSIEKSIAVLPFVNLSNDPEQEYFSDGMVDEILDRLFKVGDLKVIARTSSMRYKNTKLTLKEIAAELGVSALLEGSVQKLGNKVRITAQLIDPKTGFHIWSETYDKDLSDVFSIQSEVAQNVARELKAKLTSKETQLIQNAPLTTNQLAYDFYLKGNDYWSKFETLLALDMYSKAIQEDSLFAAAYAQRAKIHLFFKWGKLEGWQGHDLKAKEDIKKGIRLNPGLPEVKLAQAISYYQLDLDYYNALKILKELTTEAPNLPDVYAYISYILRRQGKWEESVSEAKHGLLLDPFNANYFDNLSQTYQFLHQYNNQIDCLKKGLSLIPDYKKFNYYIFYAYLDKTADLKIALKESGLKEEDVKYQVYYYTRQYNKLIELIRINDSNLNIEYNKEYEHRPEQRTSNFALIYYLSGNKALCRVYADSAITYLKDKIKEIPDDDSFYATLGKCYALIGNNIEAIDYGNKEVNMMPIKLDAISGVVREQDLMEIYILNGDYNQALDKIEYLLSISSKLSIGKLMIDPIFDNLRSLQRFQKIIGSAQK